MKQLISKLFKIIKDIIINIINKLFKKIEDNIPDDLGAKFYGPMEADPRDFKAENVLQNPTREELQNLPERYNILEKVNGKFIATFQGCVPSCTISSLSNYIGILKTIEAEDKYISTQKGAEINRGKMGHKWVCQGERGDYLETALKVTKKNGMFTVINNSKQEYSNIDGYAYYNTTKDNLKYWISKGYPAYTAIRGDKNTWLELSRGEVKTYDFTPTGGHAITAIGYDEKYLHFINTWNYNDGDEYIGDYSVFKISWEVLDELLKRGLFNWRCWIVYMPLSDKNKQMFKDYKIDENTEAGQAVKYLKQMDLVKGVPHKDGTYLEPARPITRLEVLVLLYRLLKFLGRAK